MRNQTIISALPFWAVSANYLSARRIIQSRLTITSKSQQRNKSHCQRRHNMNISPRIYTTCPVKRQQHQSRTDHEQKRPNWITFPNDFPPRHLRKVGFSLRVVEEEEAQNGGGEKASLDPENVAPATCVGVCCCACAESTDSGKELVVSPL